MPCNQRQRTRCPARAGLHRPAAGPDEARKLYQRVLRQEPDNATAKAALLASLGDSKPQKAGSLARDLAEQNPQSAAALATLGGLMARDNRLAETQQAYFKAVTLEPENALYAYNLAVALDRLANTGQAARYYTPRHRPRRQNKRQHPAFSRVATDRTTALSQRGCAQRTRQRTMNAPAPQNGKPPVRLGDLLLEKGLITQDQLRIALHEQKNLGKPLGETLIALGFVTESSMRGALAENLKATGDQPEKHRSGSARTRLHWQADCQTPYPLPVSYHAERNELLIASADPNDIVAADQINALLAERPETALATGLANGILPHRTVLWP